jgi:hypothetical protein
MFSPFYQTTFTTTRHDLKCNGASRILRMVFSKLLGKLKQLRFDQALYFVIVTEVLAVCEIKKSGHVVSEAAIVRVSATEPDRSGATKPPSIHEIINARILGRRVK